MGVLMLIILLDGAVLNLRMTSTFCMILLADMHTWLYCTQMPQLQCGLFRKVN